VSTSTINTSATPKDLPVFPITTVRYVSLKPEKPTKSYSVRVRPIRKRSK